MSLGARASLPVWPGRLAKTGRARTTRTAQYGAATMAGTNSSGACFPLRSHRKVVVPGRGYQGGKAYTAVNKRVMLKELERPHRKRRCEVCCLPFPMRLAQFRAADPGVRPVHSAEARVQSSSSTKRSRLRPRTQEDRFKKPYGPEKTPLIATCTNERRSGFETSTPSPASTLNIAPRFFRSSLLQTEGRF